MKKSVIASLMLFTALAFQACTPNVKNENASSQKQEVKQLVKYTLPKAPNKKRNNLSLGGIDRNRNGVRDDVEIWIYTKHDNPVERAIYIQIAKAYQQILTHPEALKKNVDLEYSSVECETYWELEAKNAHENFYISSNRNLTNEISDIILNTEDRMIAFDEYQRRQNTLGDTVRDTFNLKQQCDFDAQALLKTDYVLLSANGTLLQSNI